MEPNQTPKPKQKSKQRVASRLPVVQSWFGLEQGTRSLNNESLITGGQGTSTVRQLAQSRAKYSNGWGHLSCLAKPSLLADSWLPAALLRGWAHHSDKDFSATCHWLPSAFCPRGHKLHFIHIFHNVCICPTRLIL